MQPHLASALILAAGKGTRMHSPRPKVLAEILGEPMLRYVYAALMPLFGDDVFTVVGHGADLVRQAFPQRSGRFVLQAEQLGTGHALQVAMDALRDTGRRYVLVVNGDTPLIPAAPYEDLLENAVGQDADIAFMTVTPPDPGDFGRVLRKDGRAVAIIEAKDYDPAEHGPEPREINAGVYCLRMEAVQPLLARLTNDNKSGEYYITDLVGLAVQEGMRVEAVNCGDDLRFLGVNSPAELVAAEDLLAGRIAQGWLERGAIVRNAQAVRIGPDVRLEPGAEITGPAELYGRTTVAAGARILSNCWITDSEVAEEAVVKSFSHLEGARVGPAAQVGPYARLRPGAVLEDQVRVGNFVEVKKATLRTGAKANHLAYLGDAEVGQGANVGAGAITCNYDGRQKHHTAIGKGAFIGSNAALVAPVNVGENALVGAGSVITKDVGDDEMAIARGKQKNLPRRRTS